MPNANKAKGSRWELELRRRLQERGLRVTRPWQEGHDDSGDAWIEDWFVAQAKNYASIATALSEGVAGAQRQAVVAKRRFGIAFVKRRGKSAGQGYAVMEIDDFIDLLLLVGELRSHTPDA